MSALQIKAIMFVALMLVWFAVELGMGGGDPNHKDHNRPPWMMW